MAVIGQLRGGGWSRAVRIAAPLGALVVEGWPALVGALLVQEGGLWVAGRLSGTCQQSLLKRIFLAAYGLRVAIALPTHYIAKLGDGNGALFRDDYTNDLVGEWLVRIARGDGTVSIFPGHQYLLDSAYTYLVMAIYALFGYAPLLPKLLNIGLAALSAVLIFEIARKIFSTRAAVLAAVGAAILPSLLVWSVATLKETLVLFTSLMALWLVQFLSTADRRDRRFMDALVALLAVELLLLDLRSTIAAVVVGLVAIVYFARSHFDRRWWQTALAAVIVLGVVSTGLLVVRSRSSDRPLSAVFEDAALQIRHRRAQEAASARTQLRPELEVISPTGSSGLPAAEAASDAAPFSVISDVVDPLGYALFAPAPWQAESPAELAASAEMPIWYVLLAASLFAWRAAPRQRLFVCCLVAYGIANWLILAAVEGNLGNLLRHRLTLDACLLILGGAGLEWMWMRVARSATALTYPDSAAARSPVPQPRR
ncbi:MAG: hypothetical protein E6I52_17700 [Chloroflexi bacterium]|nr:MAG: hypothetical protein E6I52_17700 [Chloroflexota bacterium]